MPGEKEQHIDFSKLCPFLRQSNALERYITIRPTSKEGKLDCNEGEKDVGAEILDNGILVRCWGCIHQPAGFKETIEAE